MRKFAYAGLTGLFLLAACAPAVPEPEPVAEPAPAKAAAPTAAAEPDAEPAEPVGATRLIGLSPKAVQTLVGEPALVRREDNVQVMLFETDACVLEVVFYEPAPGDWFAAKSVSARTRRGANTDTDTCLAGLLPDGRWRE